MVIVALLLVAIVSQETNALLIGLKNAPRQMVHHRQSCLRLAAFDPKKELQKFVPPSIIGEEIPLSSDVTELPNTFQDAVSRAVDRSMASIKSGQMRVRIDFDTSIGDMTYTSLKNSLPMMKEFAIGLTKAMQLTMSIDIPDAVPSEGEAAASTTPPSVNNEASEGLATMRIFFPDMGAAALARRDWKLGSEVAEVPPAGKTSFHTPYHTPSHTFSHTLSHPFTHLITTPLTPSHTFSYTLPHPFSHNLSLTLSRILSHISHAPFHPPLIPPLAHPFTPPLMHLFTQAHLPLPHSLTPSLIAL